MGVEIYTSILNYDYPMIITVFTFWIFNNGRISCSDLHGLSRSEFHTNNIIQKQTKIFHLKNTIGFNSEKQDG